ncbi:MAG: UbiX family flavin prenyltransferase [Epsilonproteobacteria bacterium]|nr:UbiX family flavin prenyltransferase [Campylobacterota bacterium]
MKKIVIAASGASGTNLALKTVNLLPQEVEKHFIATEHAKTVTQKETKHGIIIHQNNDIAASIASGSFGVDGMLIVPCSMNTLAKIAHGIADNLITRCAAVMIKEQKRLILAPRELPFSPIALENMHKLAMIGVVIAPPVLAYYSKQHDLEMMENFMIGKWFDLLGIENNLYQRWEQDNIHE